MIVSLIELVNHPKYGVSNLVIGDAQAFGNGAGRLEAKTVVAKRTPATDELNSCGVAAPFPPSYFDRTNLAGPLDVGAAASRSVESVDLDDAYLAFAIGRLPKRE